MLDKVLKRIFDVLASLCGLVFFSPIMLMIGYKIKKEDRGPIFYRGVRIGRSGRPFRILKFRTMVLNAEVIGGTSTAEDDIRITEFGRFLRRYKLDEIPQLINVFRGEMSIVGPRPQVPWAVSLYKGEERLILSLKPGITDYASIKFKNEAEILKGSLDPDRDYLEKIAPEKIRLGLAYVHDHSLWTDLNIIASTLYEIFQR